MYSKYLLSTYILLSSIASFSVCLHSLRSCSLVNVNVNLVLFRWKWNTPDRRGRDNIAENLATLELELEAELFSPVAWSPAVITKPDY